MVLKQLNNKRKELYMAIIATIECTELNLTQTILDTPTSSKALAKLGIKDFPYSVKLPRKEYEDFL